MALDSKLHSKGSQTMKLETKTGDRFETCEGCGAAADGVFIASLGTIDWGCPECGRRWLSPNPFRPPQA